ncbi:MAG TPA: zinc dependent phospholipase C family protein [Terriglobia bacterium]|nr:zinc dependent phospholipase C family protein [Terriglobia bacterium]
MMSRPFSHRRISWFTAFLAALVVPASVSRGYSVLSHEATIDAVWDPVIKPLLLARYPTASEAQLQEAHAYAYGGCVIQDMGYYPFGNRFFSDLTHYVRSGDFVEALLQESADMYEYSFALGALAHYAADNSGHPLAVNLSVSQMYPKLRKKYGKSVTFEDDPKVHVLVEFSFDVVQLAGAGYKPETYHNFIGFKVSKDLLNRAFKSTYGLDARDVFLDEDLAIGTYRRGASEIIPQMTAIAWKKERGEIRRVTPGITRKQFVYKLSRADYQGTWGKSYKKMRIFRQQWGEPHEAGPGLLARILVFLFEHLPKVGPFQTLSFKLPTPQAERLFTESFTVTTSRYQKLLGEVRQSQSALSNNDFDTGKATRGGEYRLADRAYAGLLDRLAQENFRNVTPELRSNILAFYGDLSAPIDTKKDPKEWDKVQRELDALRAAPAQTVTGTIGNR